MACIFCDFPCLSNSLIFKKIKNAKNMAQKAGVRRCFLRFPSDVSLCRDFIANNSIFFKPMPPNGAALAYLCLRNLRL